MSKSVMVQVGGVHVFAVIEHQPLIYDRSINFRFMGRFYKFNINIRALVTKYFFSHERRDVEVFGDVTSPILDAIVRKISIDILTCLGKIFDAHQCDTLAYAGWYNELMGERSIYTYSKVITLLTCHNIVRTQFISSGVGYKLIEF